MENINAVVRDGRIETEEPLDLPNGTKLVVRRRSDARDDDESHLTPDEWDDSPEGIKAWLELHDSLHHYEHRPLFTPEEFAAWQQARKEQREWEFAHADERAEKLRKLFE